MRVEVPFGRRTRVGLAIQETERSALASLKEVAAILDTEPVVPEPLLQMILWGADYYLTSPGEALKSALPALLWRQRPRRRAVPRSNTPAAFQSHPEHPLTAKQQKIVEEIWTKTPSPQPSPPRGEGEYKEVFLLHGVTGSGKTEVYLELARRMIAGGGSVLVLVPEISLTPQLTGRFQSALGIPIASYHSGLTNRQREQVWEESLNGSYPVVIGTRSALFLPLKNLRLIIVDEEHDPSYKQEERFRYHARDLALVRGRDEKCVVVLGSATPSLESYHRAQTGKHHYLQLLERPGVGQLPDVRFIDLRRQTPPAKGQEASLITDKLAVALDQTLQRGEQSLLFLNRRGFHSIQLCLVCGESLQCPHCQISLTLHKKRGQIVCHYCHYEQKEAPRCRRCDSNHFTWVGWGTERIEAELNTRFPQARIARLDSDTARKLGTLAAILTQMKRQEIDILIGTQILTKGHDYPAVTLVGVLLAESSLGFPSFRAAERTFQLITQVAGRAGRADRPGEVLVQGYNPNHYSLRFALAQDFRGFAETELAYRKSAGYPPFRRLVQITMRGRTAAEAASAARRAATHLQRELGKEATLLGPAPCPIEKLRNEFRWQILLKTDLRASFRKRLQAVLDGDFPNILPSKVKFAVDVDPITLL